jgi:hypothetical protein
VTVSGSPGWTTNQWATYTLRKLSDIGGLNTLVFSHIYSNTANTINYSDNGGYNFPSMAFTAGDSLEIRKVDHALDQPGRAGRSLISGDNPVPPLGWNDQVTEPCYAWNNGNAALTAHFGQHPAGR